MALSKADLAAIAEMIAAAQQGTDEQEDTSPAPKSAKSATKAKARKVNLGPWTVEATDGSSIEITQAKQSKTGTVYRNTRVACTPISADGKRSRSFTLTLPQARALFAMDEDMFATVAGADLLASK